MIHKNEGCRCHGVLGKGCGTSDIISILHSHLKYYNFTISTTRIIKYGYCKYANADQVSESRTEPAGTTTTSL